MKTLLVIISILFVSQLVNAEVRVKIYLETTSTTTATQIRDAIRNKAQTYSLRLQRGREFDYGKGTINDPKMFWGSCFYEFNTASQAENFYQWARQNMPAGVHGRASAHFCPIDGEAPANWQGCKEDPRAQYKEVSW